MSDLLISQARLFDPTSGLDAVGDLFVKDGMTVAIGVVESSVATEIVRADGLWLFPGLIDLHVHLRQPGQEHKETIATGTRAAAAGGFTAVACEPNTSPPCDSAERLGHLLELTAREAVVEVMPKCAISVGQRGERLTDFEALRQAGAVAASDDGFSVKSETLMRQALLASKASGLPLTVHVDGPEMIERDLRLAAETGAALHFSHISLAAEVELIARARARGIPVTGEASPHHLTLTREEAPADDPNYKMNPPLATRGDRAALRAALADGILTVIASDHAPHNQAEKDLPYPDAPPGVIGLETTLGALWTHLIHQGHATPAEIITALTVGPAGILGIIHPAFRLGAQADFTLFDPNAKWQVDPNKFLSKARNCPFAGQLFRGRPVATFCKGRLLSQHLGISSTGATE